MQSPLTRALLFPVDLGVAELAVAEFPERFASIIILDSEAADIREQVEHVRERPGVLGIRIVAGFPTTGENIARARGRRVRTNT